MSLEQQKILNTVGGSGTHVILEFPNLKPLYMGSLITVSYNSYRDKTPVFNCGQPTIDGFAIGNKYIAGSMITTMFTNDEFSTFMTEYDEFYKDLVDRNTIIRDGDSLKEVHTRMKDDLTSFNIHIIFTSEYNQNATRIIIYDANFMSTGQVMSIDDFITETTHQFVAKDIREQHDLKNEIRTVSKSIILKKGSSIVSGLRNTNKIVQIESNRQVTFTDGLS